MFKLLPRFDDKDTPTVDETRQQVDEIKYNYKKDSRKTLREISSEVSRAKKAQRQTELETEQKNIKEQVEEPKTDQPKAEIKAEPKPEDIKPPEKVEVKEEPKPDTEAIAKKAAEEVAMKVRDEFRAEVDKILNKDKTDIEKQKELDELIPVWQKENRVPKDWEEIAKEQLRIADARFEQRMKAQEAEAKAKQETEAQAVKQREEDTLRKNKEGLAHFQNQVTNDLNELFEAKLLTKPANVEDINNPNTTDPAAKEIQEIMAFGVKLNTERVKQNLPAVLSLNKIFFLHYQPFKQAAGKAQTNQPAGADAPILGARNTPAPESKKPYVYARDHQKSFREIALEVAREARRR